MYVRCVRACVRACACIRMYVCVYTYNMNFTNSVGDLVANLAMAKAGMPAMAAGACLGAPTLNLLLGGGLSTLLGTRGIRHKT